MPYDQFLTRQLAADIPGSGGKAEDIAALGFLTLGRRFLNSTPDIIDDRIDVITRGTMSLTVSCARCHDHKFDPISREGLLRALRRDGLLRGGLGSRKAPAAPRWKGGAGL